MNLPLLIIGAGGHARVLIDALLARSCEIRGIIDRDPLNKGTLVLGIPVVGDDGTLRDYAPESFLLVNGVGSVARTAARQEVFQRLGSLGYRFASVIHPSAVVASNTELAEGVQLMAGVVVQTGSRIGANSIVNTRAAIDHDCRIGAHAHIAPGVTLCGAVTVGEGSHVGTGATIVQGRTIGKNCLVAAGAVVVRDVADGTTVIGVPARRVL